MKVEWTSPANRDARRIDAHIRQDNPSAARELIAGFRSAAERLAAFPMMGRAGRLSGTREFVAHPNYILLYRIEIDSVRILRVLHVKMKWP